MTTATGGNREKRLFDRVALWCHHHSSAIWTTYFGVQIAGALTVSAMGSDGHDPVSWVSFGASMALCVAALLSMIGSRLHMKFWDCRWCHDRQPLDAPAQAEKYRATLIARHQRGRLIAFGVLAIASLVGGQSLVAWLAGAQFGPLAMAPACVFIVYDNRSARLHDQLRPWCPICRRRDEDDDPIDVPAPTPPSAKIVA